MSSADQFYVLAGQVRPVYAGSCSARKNPCQAQRCDRTGFCHAAPPQLARRKLIAAPHGLSSSACTALKRHALVPIVVMAQQSATSIKWATQWLHGAAAASKKETSSPADSRKALIFEVYWWASRESNTAPTDYESALLVEIYFKSMTYNACRVS